MKYIKKFENITNQITITLDDFVESVGDMHEAITLLINLKNNSESLYFTVNENKHKHYYKSEDIVMYECINSDYFSETDDDMITLRIGDYVFSHGYLKANKKTNREGINITFYNYKKNLKNKVSMYINTKKYNL